eukprot:scaffold96136_cov37-Tisochrysis_lutea.AAC.2
MFGLKAEATAEQKEAMASGIRGMVDNIPEILKITCGYDIGISQGNRDFVLCTCAAALQAGKGRSGMISAVVGRPRKLSHALCQHPCHPHIKPHSGADFSDEASYQKYAQHPAHLDVIDTLIKPIIEPGTRTAVQFSLAQGNM